MSALPGVALIRLDRPERGNALSPALVGALHAHLRDALADPAIHTVALLGDGRNFCTGFDLSDLDTVDDAALLQRFVQVELLLDAVWRAPVRTVALAHGRAWGAGADLFAACDVRLAAPDASFRFPGAGFGLVLGTRRLGVRVGRDEARRLTCDGAALDTTGALRCGLATGTAEASINGLAAHCPPPAADRETVSALRAATATTAESDADADLAALVRSAARPGLKERIAAYRARTAPTTART